MERLADETRKISVGIGCSHALLLVGCCVLLTNSVSVVAAEPASGGAVTLGARVSAPLGLSGSASVVIGSGEEDDIQVTRGVLIRAEVGTKGRQYGIGVGVVGARGLIPLLAGSVQVVVTDTSGTPWLATPESRYVGLQLDAAIMAVNARLGLSRRRSGEPADRRWVVTFGVGLGF